MDDFETRQAEWEERLIVNEGDEYDPAIGSLVFTAAELQCEFERRFTEFEARMNARHDAAMDKLNNTARRRVADKPPLGAPRSSRPSRLPPRR